MARTTRSKPRQQKRQRGKPRRVVVSARLDPESLAEIAHEADRQALTVSEEISRRLQQFKAYEEGMGRLADFQIEVRRAEIEGFNAALEKHGYTRYVGAGGVAWIEPAARTKLGTVPDIAILYPNLEAAIVSAIERAVDRTLRKNRKE